MSASVNKAIIMGYVGNDPEVKSIFNGNLVANLSIATKRYRKNANGERDDKTDWHRCTFWGRQAETVQQYVKKGSFIYVEGRIEYEEWTDRENVRRITAKIVVDNWELLPSAKNPNPEIDTNAPIDLRSGTGFEDYKKGPPEPVKPTSQGPDEALGQEGDDDDSIPF